MIREVWIFVLALVAALLVMILRAGHRALAAAATGLQGLSMPLKLGLIGGNIRASRAPALHRIAGRLAGIEVSYDLLIPAELGLDFDGVLAKARAEGYRGVNVTYPLQGDGRRPRHAWTTRRSAGSAPSIP